jgi:hypothetical protein
MEKQAKWMLHKNVHQLWPEFRHIMIQIRVILSRHHHRLLGLPRMLNLPTRCSALSLLTVATALIRRSDCTAYV